MCKKRINSKKRNYEVGWMNLKEKLREIFYLPKTFINKYIIKEVNYTEESYEKGIIIYEKEHGRKPFYSMLCNNCKKLFREDNFNNATYRVIFYYWILIYVIVYIILGVIL
jgi:hypothetical protein